jgi:hypothetical protein
MRMSARQLSSIERVRVRNVLNPILWLCGLIAFPAMAALGFSPHPSWVHIVLATVPVGVALYSYIFFMLRDPDRLQSESFQLRKQALELIEEKGNLAIVESTSIEVISNPDLPALPAPEDAQ